MPYQYVREPLTAEEADRLSNACETPTERLVVWTLLDTGLCVSELCDPTSNNVFWQERQLRYKSVRAVLILREVATHKIWGIGASIAVSQSSSLGTSSPKRCLADSSTSPKRSAHCAA